MTRSSLERTYRVGLEEREESGRGERVRTAVAVRYALVFLRDIILSDLNSPSLSILFQLLDQDCDGITRGTQSETPDGGMRHRGKGL